MTLRSILETLKRKGSKKNIAGMARFGIVSPKAFGVSVAHIRALARKIGVDQTLALRLWKSGWFEARLLAAFVADPTLMTPRLMTSWAKDFDNWAVTDGLCLHLFRKTAHAHDMARAWTGRRPEFVKRAGFAMIATLAVHDAAASDTVFVRYLAIVKRHATDERNAVKKSVNWALRQIGKRNASLYKKAVGVAIALESSSHATARWVAKDALREFKMPGTRARIMKKPTA
jgi:3-methyladenine DNA glycosylase AlkD